MTHSAKTLDDIASSLGIKVNNSFDIPINTKTLQLFLQYPNCIVDKKLFRSILETDFFEFDQSFLKDHLVKTNKNNLAVRAHTLHKSPPVNTKLLQELPIFKDFSPRSIQDLSVIYSEHFQVYCNYNYFNVSGSGALFFASSSDTIVVYIPIAGTFYSITTLETFDKIKSSQVLSDNVTNEGLQLLLNEGLEKIAYSAGKDLIPISSKDFKLLSDRISSSNYHFSSFVFINYSGRSYYLDTSFNSVSLDSIAKDFFQKALNGYREKERLFEKYSSLINELSTFESTNTFYNIFSIRSYIKNIDLNNDIFLAYFKKIFDNFLNNKFSEKELGFLKRRLGFYKSDARAITTLRSEKNLTQDFIFKIDNVQQFTFCETQWRVYFCDAANEYVYLKETDPLYNYIDNNRYYINLPYAIYNYHVKEVINIRVIVNQESDIDTFIKRGILNYIKTISSFNTNGRESQYLNNLKKKFLLGHQVRTLVLNEESTKTFTDFIYGEVISNDNSFRVTHEDSITPAINKGVLRCFNKNKPFSITFDNINHFTYDVNSITYRDQKISSDLIDIFYPPPSYLDTIIPARHKLKLFDEKTSDYYSVEESILATPEFISYHTNPSGFSKIFLTQPPEFDSHIFNFQRHIQRPYMPFRVLIGDGGNWGSISGNRNFSDFNLIVNHYVNKICLYISQLKSATALTLTKDLVITNTTIGQVNAAVSVSNTGTFLIYVNGFRIKQSELSEVLNKALCFVRQEDYDSFLSDVSSTSLLARKILDSGLMVTIASVKGSTSDPILFEFDKSGRTWYSVFRNVDNSIRSKHKINGGISEFIRRFSGTAKITPVTPAAFTEMVSSLEGFNFNDFIKTIKITKPLINVRLARSRQLLEETVKLTKAQFLKPEDSHFVKSGYTVTGTSGTKYFIACKKDLASQSYTEGHYTDDFGKVYEFNSKNYICIVDKDIKSQYGYDVIVNRLLSLRNDSLVARQVNTLTQFTEKDT